MGGGTWWEDRRGDGGVGSGWMGGKEGEREGEGERYGDYARGVAILCHQAGRFVLRRGGLLLCVGRAVLTPQVSLLQPKMSDGGQCKELKRPLSARKLRTALEAQGLPSSIANVAFLHLRLAVLHLRQARRTCWGTLCWGQWSREGVLEELHMKVALL